MLPTATATAMATVTSTSSESSATPILAPAPIDSESSPAPTLVPAPTASSSLSSPSSSSSPSPSPVAGPSKEGDVNLFKVPHSRMLELVNSNIRPVETGLQQQIDGDSPESLEFLLQEIYSAMWELKSHEYIENTFIMDRLKARLQARRIYNQLVCNCHEDSKLLQVIDLVEEVYSAQTSGERQAKGRELQAAIKSFLGEFLHHMEEEEAVFTPLLQENFEKKELDDMNEMVLRQHSLFREKVKHEKRLKGIKRRREEPVFSEFQASLEDLRFRKTYCQEVKDKLQVDPMEASSSVDPSPSGSAGSATSTSEEDNNNKLCQLPAKMKEGLVDPVVRPEGRDLQLNDLPTELLSHVFTLVGEGGDPRDLLRAAQVCHRWNSLALAPRLWQCLPVARWAAGSWSFAPASDEEREDLARSFLRASPNGSLTGSTESLNSIASSNGSGSDHAHFKVPEAPAGRGREGDDAAAEIDLEQRVICGVLMHLLPAVGPSVTRIELGGIKSLGNAQIRGFLRNCPNVRYLDLSHTGVNERAFFSLARSGSLRWLEELVLEGCRDFDDKALDRLSQCFEGQLMRRGKAKLAKVSSSRLKILNLSGCASITSSGLPHLSPYQSTLQELDLSGCFRLPGPALSAFAAACTSLKPAKLAYCNDIEDGPYPAEASGCQNMECLERFCCQKLF